MAAGYDGGTCGATTGWRIVVTDCTTGTSTDLSFSRYDFGTIVDDFITELEATRLRCRLIRAMAKPPIERAPRLLVALNTGMHIRRMRASAGLARART